jgi:hypothetical protein
MNTLISIIEDPAGNVIGATTDKGDVMLKTHEITPRANLKAVAVTLATAYDIKIPAPLMSVVNPPANN